MEVEVGGIQCIGGGGGVHCSPSEGVEAGGKMRRGRGWEGRVRTWQQIVGGRESEGEEVVGER